MGMLVVSDDEFNSAIDNCLVNDVLPINEINKDKLNQVLEGTIVDKHGPGRREDTPNVPNSLRKIIGETGALDGQKDAVELAKRFGISKSSVSAYSVGATSTDSYDEPKEDIVNHIQRSKDRVSNKARAILFKSLRNITSEKLEGAKPEVLSGIAKDMSSIIKNNEDPVNPNNNPNAPQFIIYAPQFTQEDKFETIQVND